MFVRCGSFPASAPQLLILLPSGLCRGLLKVQTLAVIPEYVPELTPGLALTTTPILELSHTIDSASLLPSSGSHLPILNTVA
jgi:hypothetical protein